MFHQNQISIENSVKTNRVLWLSILIVYEVVEHQFQVILSRSFCKAVDNESNPDRSLNERKSKYIIFAAVLTPESSMYNQSNLFQIYSHNINTYYTVHIIRHFIREFYKIQYNTVNICIWFDMTIYGYIHPYGKTHLKPSVTIWKIL